MKIQNLILTVFLSSIVGLYAGDLEEMYKPEIKKVKASEFTSKFGPFKWGGANKRVAMSTTSKLFEYRIREAIAYFDSEGELKRLDSWIYNRGDDGNMPQEKFEAFYEKLLVELENYYKVKPKKSGISGATRSTAYTFTLSYGNEISLLVGFDKRPYRADFLCLVMRNYEDKRARGSDASEKFVTKKDNGDVIIDKIPMIDQGPKGYCVPATLARIGQHYGVDISMHEIAMISDSTAGGGTSPRLAMSSLKKNYARVKLKIREINMKTPDPHRMTPSAAYDLSTKIDDDDSKVMRFHKEVKKRIDKGFMLAWSMVVGLLPENGEPARQGGGGHMRMIIGYNEAKKEIIFSDSWGPGHEIKRLPLKSAYIVTSDLYEIIP
ncbi:MAG: C39 family peptidase [Lentisphaeraceae bacterium]|nr:C39 family peptidase [Lentisphaeraceae bacterium]